MAETADRNRAADAQAVREVYPLYRDVETLNKAERDAVGAGLPPREAEAWRAIEEIRHSGDGWQDRLRESYDLRAQADDDPLEVAIEVEADAGAVASVDAYEDGGDADVVALSVTTDEGGGDDGASVEDDDWERADA